MIKNKSTISTNKGDFIIESTENPQVVVIEFEGKKCEINGIDFISGLERCLGLSLFLHKK